MYNLKHNNYNKNPKNSTIYTPPAVSQFIFELLKDKVEKRGIIFAPCCGKGSLLKPWKKTGYGTWGNDKDKRLKKWLSPNEIVKNTLDFLTTELKDWKLLVKWKITLILCNPPFNGYKGKLGSEIWLDKIIELFGKEVPIVLFAPVGFCSNLTLESKRLEKFENGTYPPIASRITLPKNIFEGVIFHSEILIFNVKGLKAHYFLSKNYDF